MTNWQRIAMGQRQNGRDSKHSSSGAQWSNSGYILRVELMSFAELDMGYEIKKRYKDHTKFCEPSN